MTLSILAPRPRGELVTFIISKPQSAQMYDESEWAAKYPEIERLYIRERRKLRYIIQFMEREHGFKATEQMYKKRFARWGFQKSTKRSTTDVQRSSMKDRCRNSKSNSPAREPSSIPIMSPGSSPEDRVKLKFFNCVRTWSMAFFDGLQVIQQQPLKDHSRSVEAKEISFAFKLSIDLLNRGYGKLAGRIARKAFLLIEDLFTLEGPALMWNLLEMMHYMVLLRHHQLFQMLLAHLVALANDRMPEAHPLSIMLQTLRRLTEDPRASVSSSPSPPFSSSSSCSSTGGGCVGETIITVDDFSRALLSLLEQAWISNAKILFDHFDPELIQLYWCLLWDSCSIKFPVAIVEVVVQWLSQHDAACGSESESESAGGVNLEGVSNETHISNPSEQHRMLRRLISPSMYALPLHDQEILRASSIAALRERGTVILEDGVDCNGGNSTTLLGLLAGLVTAKILEGRPDIMVEGSSTRAVPHIHTVTVACVIRTLMDDMHMESDGRGEPSGSLDRLRMIVALREYLQGKADPQVVREMWLLEDALNTAGEYGEAQEVKRDSFRRLETYVQDISVGSA